MFQYAFYLSLKQHFRKVKADLTGFENYPLHNGFELENIFHLQLEKATAFELRLYTPERRDWLTRKLRRVYRAKHAWYEEKTRHGYDASIFKDKHARYFWGYWQHHRYASGIEPELRKAFTFKNALEGDNLGLSGTIRQNNAVSVHVRRGDYVGHPFLDQICGLDYYQEAIKIMQQQLSEPFFVVFSDDPTWCKESLTLPESTVFVDWNRGQNSYIDMELMSHCKHHIIANSSFSWWGAWLNPSEEKKVVSPAKWVTIPGTDSSGLILPHWIKI